MRLAPGQALSGQNFNGWGMNKGAQTGLQGEGRANRFGVKGSEDLGNGLKAVYQIEIGVNFDTNYNLARQQPGHHLLPQHLRWVLPATGVPS